MAGKESDNKFVQMLYEPQHTDILKSMEKQNIFFKDIDRNGRINVVFAVQTEENVDEKVVCFDHKGRILWSHPAGREIQYGNQTVSADFDIQKFPSFHLGRNVSHIALLQDFMVFIPISQFCLTTALFSFLTLSTQLLGVNITHSNVAYCRLLSLYFIRIRCYLA